MAYVYFDLGNVLLAFSQQRRVAQLARLAGVTVEAINEQFFEPRGDSLFARLECGDVDPMEVHGAYSSLAGQAIDYGQFHRAASDIFTPIMETIALAERLAAAGNRIGVLSNTSVLDWKFAVMRYAFLNRLFGTHVLSYEVRALKPSAAIYEHAVARAKVAPAEVFFVDDFPDNVAAARAFGIDAVQFTTPSALCDALRERGFKGV